MSDQEKTATPAVGGEALRKAIIRLREYAGVLDSDAYADINEPNLRGDIELVCSAAQPATPAVGGEARKWVVDLIHNSYDPKPSDYRPGDNWSDGAEEIADQIIARFAAQPASPLRGRETKISAIIEEIEINRKIGADHRFSDDEWLTIEAALRASASSPEQPAAAPPRPLAEWHEDMGPQLWWCWTTQKPLLRERGGANELPDPGHWLGEEPYVGSPTDIGKEVLIQTCAYTTIAGASEEVQPYRGASVQRINIGGWPGYHTHFTPLPPMPEVPCPT